MKKSTPNNKLQSVMALANCTNSGLAKRVVAVAAAHKVTVGYDHVNVKRWLDGVRPRGLTPHFVAEALGQKLGRPVSLAEIGMESNDDAVVLAADRYPEDLADSVEAISALVRADLAGNATALASGVDPAGWSDLMVRWLVAPDLAEPGISLLSDSPIEAVSRATALFSQLDYQFGGGYARSSLVQYVNAEVTPLLAVNGGRGQPRELLAEASALLRLTGWTAYDTGHHGLAHRYLTQALRLAQGADDHALGGRILANMSHQANFLGYYDQAVNLARAAQRRGIGHCTPTAMAVFYAMEARALANRGDVRECERALRDAEHWFARRAPGNDPVWLAYFEEAELAAEFAHSYRDLGMPGKAIEYAQIAIDHHTPLYVRSISFCRTVLAAGHLGRGEIELGIALAEQVLATASALRSGRCVEYVRDFVKRLEPYNRNKTVAEFVDHTGLILSTRSR
jgi:tetratricopeptide (TPR) repeat protein